MTRDHCIERMARAMYRHDFGGGDDFDVSITAFQLCKQQATAAYDAMAEHIQAERERVRAMCAKHLAGISKGNFIDPITRITLEESARAIRALDIGGSDD